MPFLLLVKSHALFPNSEKYVVEIRLSRIDAVGHETIELNLQFGRSLEDGCFQGA